MPSLTALGANKESSKKASEVVRAQSGVVSAESFKEEVVSLE